MPALLAGETDPLKIKRSRCAAGHKAMWHEEFDGLPSDDFLVKLDPVLSGLRQRLYRDTYTCDTVVGTLCPEWAEKLGLFESVVIGVGAFDAHLGAVGAGIKPYVLAKVMGTSTCDMLVAPNGDMEGRLISGICGQVDGSILPGMQGMEAGQSAFGDVYSWFKNLLMWPLTIRRRWIRAEISNMGIDYIEEHLLSELSDQAESLPIGRSGITAVDWFNGRRTPDANGGLKGALAGLTLGSDAPAVFRSLVEATAFGSKAILDRFESEGVAIKEVIALGGVAKKSSFVMQVMADVLNREIGVVCSEQTCALGAAMCAAAAAGIYESVEDARDAMESGIEEVYKPIAENVEAYKPLYEDYCRLGSFQE
jgi:L-ribulokinase